MTTDAAAAVIRRYETFAREEAPARSALYTRWATAIADEPRATAVLARIPAEHRQPPLVFAVARLLGAAEADDIVDWIIGHADALVAECGRRSLQTNEPLRCAALLPALATIPGPISLLELGASAGLCLYPDRYRYRYVRDDGRTIDLDPPDCDDEAPLLECRLRGDCVPPLRVPDIVWRAGVDRHPLDARDPGDREWLETLVWPGERGRADRIRRALDVAAADPPLLLTAEAADGCRQLAAAAPSDAILVVTTPGLLVHIPAAARRTVVEAARTAGRWLTLDPVGLHDGRPHEEGFALALDGAVLARTDPLGGWLEWLPEEPRSRG